MVCVIFGGGMGIWTGDELFSISAAGAGAARVAVGPVSAGAAGPDETSPRFVLPALSYSRAVELGLVDLEAALGGTRHNGAHRWSALRAPRRPARRGAGHAGGGHTGAQCDDALLARLPEKDEVGGRPNVRRKRSRSLPRALDLAGAATCKAARRGELRREALLKEVDFVLR